LSDIGYTVDNVLYATSKKYNNVAEWASSSFSPSRRINQ
jgi:TPP-dependent 2-oxoacid decarboxylase